MPRVELFDRNEVIQKATHLFWTKGYEATSLSDLTQELGIGKGSFYNTFGSKRKLFDSCLSQYRAGGLTKLGEFFADENDPVSGIKNFLERHTQKMLNDCDAKGCLITNSSTELAHDKEIQAFLLEHNQVIRTKIIEYLSAGPLAKDAASIADALLIHITGISVMAKFMKDEARFQASNEQFLKSLV